LPALLWQTVLHSFVAGLIFYTWSKSLGLPSGRVRRQLLGTLLILPMLTALVPGRAGFEFREQLAWMDSARVLFLPLFGSLKLYHLVLAGAAVSALATLWQELLPLLHRPSAHFDRVPPSVLDRARVLPGWGRCRVGVLPHAGVAFATTGWPWRPVLLFSQEAMDELAKDEFEMALRHENAHWKQGRWLWVHFLFLIRLLQLFNPVALWIFREYSHEVEVDCDAEAVAGRDATPLVRTLMRIYESTDPGDFSSRIALRRRVDTLLGRVPRSDAGLGRWTVLAAAAVLLVLLPWIV